MPENEYLLFQLYGPLVSWGDVAVGEVRSSYERPSKSAVLGLVAAALGIRRSEDARLRDLAGGYGFAVRLDLPGRLLRDYHTVQVPTGKRARNLPTRRDEVEYPSRTTILSSRDYRCDALAIVALWAQPDAPVPLDEIVEALRRPVFPLYLGRRACPPGLPLAPKIFSAKTLVAAFEQYPIDEELFEAFAYDERSHASLYWDNSVPAGIESSHTTQRRDHLVSRVRWQFASRHEHVASVPLPDTDDPSISKTHP